MIKRVYPKNDKTLNFKFVQNEEDFIVEEQPIKFSGAGSFLVLKIEKNNCDTWELIDRLAKFLNVFSLPVKKHHFLASCRTAFGAIVPLLIWHITPQAAVV